jgi:hypothetical protein
MSLPENPESSNEQINFDHIFGAEHRRILDEEIRTSQPIIIPPKIIEPVIVEVVEIPQPVEVIQEPEEIIEEYNEEEIAIDIFEDCTKNSVGEITETELQEMQRLSDAGISISYEEIYISLPKFVPEHIQFIEEEPQALQQALEPKIIPSKQIIQEPIVIVKEAEPEILIQQPVEVIQEPEEIIEKYTEEEKIIIDMLEDCKKNYAGAGETTELHELQRLWDAGISIISEEIYISLTKKLSGN